MRMVTILPTLLPAVLIAGCSTLPHPSPEVADAAARATLAGCDQGLRTIEARRLAGEPLSDAQRDFALRCLAPLSALALR